MKLPQLLAHFLYQNKTLSLPGIGIFTMDPSIIIPEEAEKERSLIVQGVHFENASILKPDNALIEFIHKYTGKMMPLAESDLDSYLRLGIQLLNIGKPFYFEGIGYIIKNKEDKYDFEPGEYTLEKLLLPGEAKAEIADKRKKAYDEPETDYAPQSKAVKKLLMVAGIVGGMALIAWAGYNLYKHKSVKNENEINGVAIREDTAEQIKNDTVVNRPVQIDSLAIKRKDSIGAKPSGKSDSSQYRFVILATANKSRALRRYNQLLSFDLKVKMETKDSSFFKVYFLIPAAPKDTLHIKDSLNIYYATKTLIE